MNSPNPLPNGMPDPIKTVAAIPWYQSPATIAQATGILSILLVMFPKIAVWLHFTSPDDAQVFVVKLFGSVGLLALVWGFIRRIFSKVQPVTLTAKRAAENPNTVAQMVATTGAAPTDKPASTPRV